jgi:hypothetical protein
MQRTPSSHVTSIFKFSAQLSLWFLPCPHHNLGHASPAVSLFLKEGKETSKPDQLGRWSVVASLYSPMPSCISPINSLSDQLALRRFYTSSLAHIRNLVFSTSSRFLFVYYVFHMYRQLPWSVLARVAVSSRWSSSRSGWLLWLESR